MKKKSFLVLTQPGGMSRLFMKGIAESARHLGMNTLYEYCPTDNDIELKKHWSKKVIKRCQKRNVGAVICYGFNILSYLPIFNDSKGVSLFEQLDIPCFLLWGEHPHWHNYPYSLRDEIQPILGSSNNYHFFKDDHSTYDIKRVLKWENCHTLQMSENINDFAQAANEKIKVEYDSVFICGSYPKLSDKSILLANEKNPNIQEFLCDISKSVKKQLLDLFNNNKILVSIEFIDKLIAEKMTDYTASVTQCIQNLENNYKRIIFAIYANKKAYFDLLRIFWDFTSWQRVFYIKYLSNHFNIAVMGSDWSSLGVKGNSEWVTNQGEVYRKGKVCVNINQGWDIEGFTFKPFQIIASGVPLLHNRVQGVSDIFEEDKEIMFFDSPTDILNKMQLLISDEKKCNNMARNALAKFQQEHLWENRIEKMFKLANLNINEFI